MAAEPISIEDQFAEAEIALAKLDEQEAARMQQLQEQMQQIVQRSQDVTAAGISTRGQIAELEDVLEGQRRERYQLEGMRQALHNLLPQR